MTNYEYGSITLANNNISISGGYTTSIANNGITNYIFTGNASITFSQDITISILAVGGGGAGGGASFIPGGGGGGGGISIYTNVLIPKNTTYNIAVGGGGNAGVTPGGGGTTSIGAYTANGGAGAGAVSGGGGGGFGVTSNGGSGGAGGLAGTAGGTVSTLISFCGDTYLYSGGGGGAGGDSVTPGNGGSAGNNNIGGGWNNRPSAAGQPATTIGAGGGGTSRTTNTTGDGFRGVLILNIPNRLLTINGSLTNQGNINVNNGNVFTNYLQFLSDPSNNQIRIAGGTGTSQVPITFSTEFTSDPFVVTTPLTATNQRFSTNVSSTTGLTPYVFNNNGVSQANVPISWIAIGK